VQPIDQGTSNEVLNPKKGWTTQCFYQKNQYSR